MTAIRPWDISNLVVGAPRILLADPDSTPIVDSIADVIAMESPYTPVSGWTDLGAQKESSTYTHGKDTEGVEIQQESGFIMEEITDISRTFTTDIAEIAPENLGILENTELSASVAGSTNVSPQDVVPLGSYSEFRQYRICFYGVRRKQAGVVVESGPAGPGQTERGRLVMVAFNRMQIAADDSDIEFEKGTLAAAGVQFVSFPDPAADEGYEYGRWLLERASTLASGS